MSQENDDARLEVERKKATAILSSSTYQKCQYQRAINNQKIGDQPLNWNAQCIKGCCGSNTWFNDIYWYGMWLLTGLCGFIADGNFWGSNLDTNYIHI